MSNTIETKAYACTLFDKKELYNSSSGGAFTAISNEIFDKGGAVACSIYDYSTKKLYFDIVENRGARDAARGSKYFQSSTGNIYKECVKWLNIHSEKELLFVGTGCQVAGFREYIINSDLSKMQRIIFMDLICHGVPSHKMWNEYASILEKKNNGNIEFLTFKDKENGWKKPTAYVIIKGRKVSIKSYVKVFNSHCILRESCHYCPYTSIQRESDITIGDYWGIEDKHPELFNSQGVSLVLIHSTKGAQLLKDAEGYISQKEVKISDCLQPRLKEPTSIASFKQRFWNEYRAKGIRFVMEKYGEDHILSKIKRKVKIITCVRKKGR